MAPPLPYPLWQAPGVAVPGEWRPSDGIQHCDGSQWDSYEETDEVPQERTNEVSERPRALRSSEVKKPKSTCAWSRQREDTKSSGLLATVWFPSIQLVYAIGVLVRHLMGVYGAVLCLRGLVGWRTCLFAATLWPVSGFGVTAGVHRLWSHQSYEATPLMQALLMIMFSIADQGSIIGWASLHAMHHKFSDTDLDPHNRQAGFWHSHFFWTLDRSVNHLSEEECHRITRGFGPAVYFHDGVYGLWDPFWSLLMPMLVAATWGEAFNGLFVAGALRWVCVQHITFCVNSIAHGPQELGSARAIDPSASGIGPRVSLLITFLALGEGWHDYHHCFPWDYAASELGAWDQWNPTKIFIDACGFLGLVSNRRRCSDTVQVARRNKLFVKAETAGAGANVALCDYTIVGLPFLRYRMAVPRIHCGGDVRKTL
eukprot:gnl/TRDRNA2_/TRDRNA2_83877_c0_seq1.p1 gnl/TRDRNA2_/TRDRNA2_83877_c0~~gnl/TRDRNA2_/TRDRNA2_83877_c0_seq1.p1  ORF type:complete len:427 (-),score=36.07 gnl/TRDRNA2_/TRDRNA2_83877_c0_seq1:55-1335(-)